MTTQLLFFVIMLVVLFIATQLVKKFASGFFEKISKFVPLILAGIAILAQAVFNGITGAGTFWQRVNLFDAVKTGVLIAMFDVYLYEGIYKAIRKLFKLDN